MNPNQESFVLKQLKKRILELTCKHKLAHLSSTLSALPIIFEIYEEKADDEVFILSCGHAGLALYVVLEHKHGIDAEMLLKKHGIHPSRDPENKIFCSTGSLGQGICISVGHAIANREKNVYCLISDGEAAEGRVWEALRFADDYGLSNLKIYANINGLGAYSEIDISKVSQRLLAFNEDIHLRISEPLDLGFTEGLASHYYTPKEEDLAKYIY